jgi:hypothetical protein
MAALGQKWLEEDVRAGRIPDREIHEWPTSKTHSAKPGSANSPLTIHER